MAAKKRTRAQREHDLRVIARLYLQGKTQQEIADHLNNERDYQLSRTQIKYDLKTLHQRWLASALVDYDAAQAVEIAKINQLEEEYWVAWERSVGQRVTQTTRAFAGGERRSQSRAVILKREDTVGDPRFLQGVQWCISKRIEILQLKLPERVIVEDWRTEAQEAGLDPDRIVAELEEMYYKALR
jgi:hypothetical protein